MGLAGYFELIFDLWFKSVLFFVFTFWIIHYIIVVNNIIIFGNHFNVFVKLLIAYWNKSRFSTSSHSPYCLQSKVTLFVKWILYVFECNMQWVLTRWKTKPLSLCAWLANFVWCELLWWVIMHILPNFCNEVKILFSLHKKSLNELKYLDFIIRSFSTVWQW